MSEWYLEEDELDDVQHAVYDLPTDQDILVEGSAGSGKTLLALHRAHKLHEDGENFKFLVFTNALKQFIRKGIEELGLPEDCITTEGRWHGGRTGHLVVDEVQDFDKRDIERFKDSCDHLHLFGDSYQQIYEDFRQTTTFDEIEKIMGGQIRKRLLRFNYRLPKNIAKVAVSTRHWQGQLPDADQSGRDFVENCKNEGESYAYHKSFESEEGELKFLGKYVNSESQSRKVAILVPYNRMVKKTYEYLNSLDIHCEVRYKREDEGEGGQEEGDDHVDTLDFSTSNIKILTWHSSKGLQFESVILPFMKGMGKDAITDFGWIEAAYVALTRSYRNLMITYEGVRTAFLKTADEEILKKYQ